MYRTEPRWWTSLWLRAVAIWCLLAVAAAFNGMLREVVLAPALGPRVAEPLSALLLAAVILFAAWWLVSLTFPRRPAHQWFLVGLLWAALTLALEIGFFHYGMGCALGGAARRVGPAARWLVRSGLVGDSICAAGLRAGIPTPA